ncbi:hypothetical protein LOD99_11519 [Oopsacas minuta]|uniref:CABIT domain-containing protein n=1 Tax=Oopsacas minuta TaxID=111878 RepID=A0AAV7JL36_9METZ|nr:hypothetical protein LOD99_11519 [Oopsacas minuta]
MNSQTVYEEIVLPTREYREYNPSRETRESNNPVLRDNFTPKDNKSNNKVLNYPEIEIVKKNEFTQIYKPNSKEPLPEPREPVPEPIQEPAVEEQKVLMRKSRTLEHKQLGNRRSSVRNITQIFEEKTAQKSKSFTLNRISNKDKNRRTSVREFARLFDSMAQDNCTDQLINTSLTRSTSYHKKQDIMRTATNYINFETVYSGPSSARDSPQLYMNISPSSPLKTSTSNYENWTIRENSPTYGNISPPKRYTPSLGDPYEEVFPMKYKKIPETGEIVKSNSNYTFSMDSMSPVPTNHYRALSQSSLLQELTYPKLEQVGSAERQEPEFKKPRAETIATIRMEESQTAVGKFPVTFHRTELADSYGYNSSNQISGLLMTVYRTHVNFTGDYLGKLPANIMLMDILMFQQDPEDNRLLNLIVKTGNEFQSHIFSSPSNQIDDVLACLREAVSEEKTSSLQSSDSEEYFALLLGCIPVTSATGKVAQGVEKIFATHKLSQSVQVRLDVRDGLIMYPFGRSQSLCAYKHEQVKGVAVWEKDSRVLGIVTQIKASKFICYAVRFNRTNQLQSAFTSIRHYCKGEVAEEKKKNAWYMNLISKSKIKSQSNSEGNSRSSTPVDQIDPDTFTLLYLGTTQTDYRNFSPECILHEHSNLIEGKNVLEMVAPAPTTILNVLDNSLRLTDRDKVHFRKRVYQRRMVVACLAATGSDNLIGLVTERPGTNDLKCSIFRPLFSEAGQVAQHVTNKLKLTEF